MINRALMLSGLLTTAFTAILAAMPAGATVNAERQGMEAGEAGLWMMVDRHEQELRTSNRHVDDPALLEYLRELTCRTVSERCQGLRIYVLRAPGFNAFMMPNGAMFLQTGLLLRLSDAAELAAVLGHEISHLVRAHSVERIRRWHRTASGFAIVSGIVSAAESVASSTAGSLESAARANELSSTATLMVQTAGIVATYQLLAYDRGQEKEADVDGINWMSEQGLDPFGAPQVWERILEEQRAGGMESGFSPLATHPSVESRLAYLSAMAISMRKIEGRAPRGHERSSPELLALIDPHRLDWLADELQVQHPDQFAAIADRQVELGVGPGLAGYLRARSWVAFAERHRGHVRERHLHRALSSFEEAEATAGSLPAEAHRDWGKVCAELEWADVARELLSRYLELAPDAWDVRFIERRIRRL